MHIFYRISDCSYNKKKLPGATKEICLKNFVAAFPKIPLVIICDNVTEETYRFCQGYSENLIRTNLGNAGALSFAIEQALALPPDEVVYFVEDDYLHDCKKDCPRILSEGLCHAEYATLYDHPDKYLDYGGEFSKVIRTKGSHWRFSISTTMTFATRPKVLQEDHDIWRKHTSEFHPQDHLIFSELNARGRKLAVAIPGLSCHTDLTYTETKQDLFDDDPLIEDWAMQFLEEEMKKLVKPELWYLFEGQPPLKRLMILASTQTLFGRA